MATAGEILNIWKTRLILIGLINAIIAVALGVFRGFSLPIIGLVCVGIILLVVGIVWNPQEKTDSP